MSAPILEARGLSVTLVGAGVLRREARPVLHEVDLALPAGTIVGLVGSSGSGKTTLLRALLGLVPATAGHVLHHGVPLPPRPPRAFRREVQPVFQDAHAALDPRLPVGESVAEGLDVHGLAQGPARAARVAELLSRCGLPPELAGRLPGALSAGQRQRVGIARALATEPRLLLADEPVSSLDPPVRARILALFAALRRDLGVGCLLVSHDLGAVARIADRIAVLEGGRIVEEGPAADVLRAPRHPATAALLASYRPGRAR